MSFITTEIHQNHVLLIGLNRAEKRNAFNWAMLRQLAEAFTRLEDDPALRCALLYAAGDHFTAGLDLADVAPHVHAGEPLFDASQVDPLQLYGRSRTKPVVIAVQGYCLTLGIELILACDVAVATSGATFGQIEIKRGIFPFGGATLRFHRRCGWGNAMRYLLTADTFDGAEALRIALVQELAPDADAARARGLVLAETIARQAPLGVAATLASARLSEEQGLTAARDQLLPVIRRLMDTEDAAEGLRAFLERRDGAFSGR